MEDRRDGQAISKGLPVESPPRCWSALAGIPGDQDFE